MTKSNLTTGSVGKTVVRFSLPFMLSYFLQTLYGMADLYIIGQYGGAESTAAVAAGSQVIHMLTMMIGGLSVGSVVAIGRAVGAGDEEKKAGTVGSTVLLFGVFSAAATGLLLLLTGPIVRVMAVPSQAVAGTMAYLRISFLGVPFITAYNVIGAMYRGLGDSKSPLCFVAVACVANIALDYLFIGYVGMGPAGAALGTVLAQAVSVGVSLAAMGSRRHGLGLTGSHWRLDKKSVASIMRVGVPVALQEGFIQISFIVVTVFANLRGVEDAAAVGIVEKMIGVLFLMPSAMQQTVSAMAAQNRGAGQHRRSLQTMLWAGLIAVVWGLMAVVLMHVGSARLIGLFSDNSRTVAMGCQYMRSYVWDCVFAGIHFVFSGYFCAYGLSGLAFLHSALSIVLVRVPVAYWAATRFADTLLPMGLASTVGSLLSVLICVAAYVWLRRHHRLPVSP